MPNDSEDHPERPEKIQIHEKPVPVCTLFADGSLKVEGKGIGLLELQHLMLGAVASISERTLKRAAGMEQVLSMVQQRFGGFDEATEQAMATVLGQTPAPPAV
jgi:hypothetical protein